MNDNGIYLRNHESAEMVFDLVDVVEEPHTQRSGDAKKQDLSQTDIKIFELTDVIDEKPSKDMILKEMDVMITEKITQVVERIAKDLFPEIAERVIREEIEKLKKDDGIF